MSTPSVADILEQAADILNAAPMLMTGIHTDYKGSFDTTGAIIEALDRNMIGAWTRTGDRLRTEAQVALGETLGLKGGRERSVPDLIVWWNDREGRTKIEAVQALRHAGLAERLRARDELAALGRELGS